MHGGPHVFALPVPHRLTPAPFQALVGRTFVCVRDETKRTMRRNELVHGSLGG